MRMLAVLAVVLGIGVAPVPAEASWKARTLPTSGESHLLGLDALPDGRMALLLQRGPRNKRQFELRTGKKVEVLGESCCSFEGVRLDHDSSGRLTVAWMGLLAGGSQSGLFVWTADKGTRMLGGGGILDSLDVAADGSAVIVIEQNGSIVVLRRPPGGDFGAPTEIATTAGDLRPIVPAAGVASGGRTVVAWSDCLCEIGGDLDSYIKVAAAAPGAGFGPVQQVPISSDPSITGPGPLRIAVTPAGRAVVATTVFRARGQAGDEQVVSSKVVGFDWAASAPVPSGVHTLSRFRFSSLPALIVRGESVLVAWRESREVRTARTIRSVSWNSDGLGDSSGYRPHHDVGTLKLSDHPVSLTPAGDSGARIFYKARSGRWYTVSIGASGRYRNGTAVTRKGERAAGLLAASAHAVVRVAWTSRSGRTSSSSRIRIARP